MSTDVCLVSALTISDFVDPELTLRAHSNHGTQLGVLALAASAARQGFTVNVVDTTQLILDALASPEPNSTPAQMFQLLVESLVSRPAKVIGLSTICSSYPLTLRLAREVKRFQPESFVVFGGPQATVVDVATLESFKWIDAVVRGEADETLPFLLQVVLEEGFSSGNLRTIPGVTFRHEGQVIRNPNATPIADLDTLPMPAFELDPRIRERQSVHLEIGRGCPYACTFCSTNDFFRRNFRLKSTPTMLSQMNELKTRYGITHFNLVHDMYTIDRRCVVEFCNALIEAGAPYNWGCSARTDRIDDELIALMARAGCRGIFFGIETGSASLQAIIQKNLDLNESWKRICCTDRHGISTAVALICGFPEETRDDLRETIHFFVRSRRLDYAEPQISLLAPLAKTPIEARYHAQLVFDRIYSDMSHQGWRQDPEDVEMIEQHPEVFSNFYAVPTTIPREYLRELREFVIGLTYWFRWLPVALLDVTHDLLALFDDWLRWQERFAKRSPNSRDGSYCMSRYYSSSEFTNHFLLYLGELLQGKSFPVTGVLHAVFEFECLLAGDEIPRNVNQADASPPNITTGSMVRKTPSVTLKVFDLDLQAVVQSLRSGGELKETTGEKFEFAFVPQGDSVKILRLATASAKLLSCCSGQSTVGQVLESFALLHDETAEHSLRLRKTALAGLMRLYDDGLVQISPN